MGKLTRSVELAVDAGALWSFITHPDHFPSYVAGYTRGKVTTPNATGLGSSFEWYGRAGPLELKSVETVVEWEEGRRVGYAGDMAGVPFRSSMTVTPSGPGGCTLEISIEYRVPRWMGGVLMDRAVLTPLVKGHVGASVELLSDRFGPPRTASGRFV